MGNNFSRQVFQWWNNTRETLFRVRVARGADFSIHELYLPTNAIASLVSLEQHFRSLGIMPSDHYIVSATLSLHTRIGRVSGERNVLQMLDHVWVHHGERATLSFAIEEIEDGGGDADSNSEDGDSKDDGGRSDDAWYDDDQAGEGGHGSNANWQDANLNGSGTDAAGTSTNGGQQDGTNQGGNFPKLPGLTAITKNTGKVDTLLASDPDRQADKDQADPPSTKSTPPPRPNDAAASMQSYPTTNDHEVQPPLHHQKKSDSAVTSTKSTARANTDHALKEEEQTFGPDAVASDGLPLVIPWDTSDDNITRAWMRAAVTGNHLG